MSDTTRKGSAVDPLGSALALAFVHPLVGVWWAMGLVMWQGTLQRR